MANRKDVFLRLCEIVLSTSAIELLILLVPACISLLTWRDEPAPIMNQLIVRPTDILFIGGLLAMLSTLWLYLYWVLPYVCETAWDQVVSLFITVLLFLVNYFAMVPNLLPYRYFFVAAILAVVWYKDQVWNHRFSHTKYGEVVDQWRRNMRFTCVATLFGGGLFAVLSHPSTRVAITNTLFGQPLKGTRAYEIALSAVFSAAFLTASVRSFMRNFDYFTRKGAKDIDLLEVWSIEQCKERTEVRS